MSEERMIRVHYPVDVYELDSDVRVYVEMRYYNFDGHIQRVGNQRNFDELEPAPPKDWRPYCWFNEGYDDTKPCTSESKKVHSWCCKICPWNSSQSTQFNDTEAKK